MVPFAGDVEPVAGVDGFARLQLNELTESLQDCCVNGLAELVQESLEELFLFEGSKLTE